MQAIKGYLSNGVFVPRDNVAMPPYAEVIVVIAEAHNDLYSGIATSFDDADRQARIEELDKIKAALELVDDEDLSDFPPQGLMKLPQDYHWFD